MDGNGYYEVYATPRLDGLGEFFEKISALRASQSGDDSGQLVKPETITTSESAMFGPGWTIVGRGCNWPNGDGMRIALRVPGLSNPTATWGQLRVRAALRTLGGELLEKNVSTPSFESGRGERYVVDISKSTLWDDNQAVRDDDAILVILEVTSVPATALTSVIRDPTVHRFLQQFADGDNVQDVKFLLYPYRRNGDNSIKIKNSNVQALYSNRAVLMQKSDYLRARAFLYLLV